MSNPLKKTMVYLGLADEEETYEETAPQPIARKQPQQTAPVEKAAPVTPLHRPAVVRQPSVGPVSEILTVHPKQYRDAQTIAENFREGIPVIINLSQMSDADARRLIDFASGLSLGLYGRIERVTSKVFLLSPENIAVSGDGAIAQADPEGAPFAPQ
ncbi:MULTISPECIES: cell division protein SepF [unclassified Microbacterium]|uniref:cell division protein SepF n=1 Tax=unclassified Microbacterium TaxID=2609290 RepID=UPI0006F85B0E|nr:MULTISPECIES: cell division protein SepF [unclassified Microbacterium]AOX44829.1 cell division protein SepF [Microbacterium sp. BH-3-3-3]KQT74605.1 cell division protein SepF [Microbacterium sp. Leaf436]MBD8207096.1 cell division protein SepF [Microbacterium sp. CFBP 8801]MBD8218737.1 cell division protein SepF [Microbacterium sp. CFBP 13617]MBD8479445.1 cell division protein SepF [Microbacterium sp. CFBP 8794]